MKAGIYFSGTGPILILTTYESLTDPKLVEKLSAKGIKKFIAYEVSDENVKAQILHIHVYLSFSTKFCHVKRHKGHFS